MMQVQIRKAIDIDIQAISDLAMSAFGLSEGPDIVQLIAELSVDVTAKPLLSLVATPDDRVVGHVLSAKSGSHPQVKTFLPNSWPLWPSIRNFNPRE